MVENKGAGSLPDEPGGFGGRRGLGNLYARDDFGHELCASSGIFLLLHWTDAFFNDADHPAFRAASVRP
ncbi:hypothetical protein SY2F82_74020 [Streptomyces sp. Y2F8-2]|nr:hypothetical protein SY2F82_74020 [Streptomyces sp. Y2F8-2]